MAGYRPCGGQHPVSTALGGVPAHHGVRCAGAELSEALLFGVAGGPGAGYILQEFAHDESRHVTLGFSVDGHHHDRAALDRLDVPATVYRTGGAVGAARALAWAAGRPTIIWPDRQVAGYQHLRARLGRRATAHVRRQWVTPPPAAVARVADGRTSWTVCERPQRMRGAGRADARLQVTGGRSPVER